MTSCTTQSTIVELSVSSIGTTAWSWKNVTQRDPGFALNSEGAGSGWLPQVKFRFHSLMALRSLAHGLSGSKRNGDVDLGWKIYIMAKR